MSSCVATQTGDFGDYRVLDKLGQGAMGTVFKGEHRLTGELVAIKVVGGKLGGEDPASCLRFAQECQVARLLSHPNVVRVLDFGVAGDKPYLVMEFVDGQSLGQRLEDHDRLPEKDAICLIRQVGQALHWAHEKKLIHRDIKPDNILVTAGGQAKLTDLGLAKNLDGDFNLTHTNAFFGTPNFMAPEQFVDAKRADAQSDLYSLAATLYMLVTGQLPFQSKGGVVPVLKKKRANEIDPPRQLIPELSEQLSAAILRGMRAERSERPASVLEFLDSLPEGSATFPATTPDGAREQRIPQSAIPTEIGSEGGTRTAFQRGLALFQMLILFALSMAPVVLAIAAAGRLFHGDQTLSFLTVSLGFGLTFLLLWLFVGPRLGNSSPGDLKSAGVKTP
jgi:serine/threonine protein kinase